MNEVSVHLSLLRVVPCSSVNEDNDTYIGVEGRSNAEA